jgi:CRP-like cAMP-binding protein
MVSSDLLRRYLFFTDLTEDQLKTIAGLAEEAHCQQGEALFREGHPADTLYLLMEGGVALYYTLTEDGTSARTADAMHLLMEEGMEVPMLEGEADLFKEHLVGEVHPSEIVGISALIAPYRFTATARATCPSRLLKMDAQALHRLCAEDPQLGYGLISAAAQTAKERLHFTRQQLTRA